MLKRYLLLVFAGCVQPVFADGGLNLAAHSVIYAYMQRCQAIPSYAPAGSPNASMGQALVACLEKFPDDPVALVLRGNAQSWLAGVAPDPDRVAYAAVGYCKAASLGFVVGQLKCAESRLNAHDPAGAYRLFKLAARNGSASALRLLAAGSAWPGVSAEEVRARQYEARYALCENRYILDGTFGNPGAMAFQYEQRNIEKSHASVLSRDQVRACQQEAAVDLGIDPGKDRERIDAAGAFADAVAGNAARQVKAWPALQDDLLTGPASAP